MCFYKVCQLFVHKHFAIVFCINVIAHVLKRFQKAPYCISFHILFHHNYLSYGMLNLVSGVPIVYIFMLKLVI